jgi:hypothetical protein
MDMESVANLLDVLFDRVTSHDGAVGGHCALTDAEMRLKEGTSIALVWHAIATKTWVVDMHVPLGPEHPVQIIRANPYRGWWTR